MTTSREGIIVVLFVGTLLLSAAVFGWVTVSAHPLRSQVEHRARVPRDEAIVRRACADLDREYRELFHH